MVKCQRIRNNEELMARYTSCLLLVAHPWRGGDARTFRQFTHFWRSPNLQASTSNKLDFLISVPVRLVEASCNWFHFVLLLDKHRPELPNRGRLIRQRAITTWNWVCIGDAPWVIRLKSQPEQFTRFVIYQQALN